MVILTSFSRPQRSCGQGNIFTPVCHSVHGGGACLRQNPPEQTPPPRANTPGSDTPQSRHPPRADTPRADTPRADTPKSRHPQSKHPQSRHPLEQTPPQVRHPPEQTPPPPPAADSSIRSTSGRYPSYWNAFLFVVFLVGSSTQQEILFRM